MTKKAEKDYGISQHKRSAVRKAPLLNYLPPRPKNAAALPIALIGAGNISEFHLRNYRAAGFNVAAICSRNKQKAEEKRKRFFPKAAIYTDYCEVLQRDDVAVVDITPHPADRVEIVRAALNSGKHVLSQKPFVEDLAVGEELVKLGIAKSVKQAVNQNGRWAPHFRYMSEAVRAGLIGTVTTVDFSLQWDQTWIAGNPAFEKIQHMVLYDFAIHWFDIATEFMGDKPARSIFASAAKFEGQKFNPPALACAVIDYGDAQVRLGFNSHVVFGGQDTTTITGTTGVLRSTGPSLNKQRVMIHTAKGHAAPELKGDWFTNGFQGTMGELLCAIEQDREPANSAGNNLRSLELCFAAVASAECGQPVKPGTVRTLRRE